ncbi:hypothetical protein TNIN_205911 [Trichonephila inaurata madagascariensis]|uniref:Uncharacterized protein n=1 Tax=Trichonephila inaurata madagascariensis TaxID=2747483 RepID=A0A8X7BNP6_9ARAC|nr:hypothetical protein TNIN_205911 [Trichonephila inaurata madagascariensis]
MALVRNSPEMENMVESFVDTTDAAGPWANTLVRSRSSITGIRAERMTPNTAHNMGEKKNGKQINGTKLTECAAAVSCENDFSVGVGGKRKATALKLRPGPQPAIAQS